LAECGIFCFDFLSFVGMIGVPTRHHSIVQIPTIPLARWSNTLWLARCGKSCGNGHKKCHSGYTIWTASLLNTFAKCHGKYFYNVGARRTKWFFIYYKLNFFITKASKNQNNLTYVHMYWPFSYIHAYRCIPAEKL
jgi:hypothetical protein